MRSMLRALAHRVYCRVIGTPAEALERLAQTDPSVRVGRLGDALMLFPGPAVRWSTVIGLGLDDTPPETIVPAIDAFFGPLGARPEILLSPAADPAVIAALTAGDFRLHGFRHLLRAPAGLILPPAPSAVRITAERVPGLVARGFQDGGEPRVADLRMEATFGAPANVTSFTAWIDDAPAGGGRVAIADGVALLFGASVLPAFRRRGVHTALLARRVAYARAAGADLVIIEGAAGGGTARNALRLGFEIAFTNAVLKRPEPEPGSPAASSA